MQQRPGPGRRPAGRRVDARRTGTLLDGRYRLEAGLGADEQVEVWRAHDTVLQRPVVARLLRPGVIGDARAVQRFRTQALAAAALEHPGFTAQFTIESRSDVVYTIGEYVVGSSLEQLLADGPLHPEAVADLGLQAATALHAAHATGYVHGRICPANLLLRGRELRIVDHLQDPRSAAPPGSARARRGHSFVAPEQLAGQDATAHGDVYALGATLRAALVGLRGDTRRRTCGARTCGIRRGRTAGRPPLLSATLADATRARPEARPTAGDLAERLTAAGAGHRDLDARLPAPSATERPVRPLALVAALTLVAVLGLGAGTGLPSQGTPSADAPPAGSPAGPPDTAAEGSTETLAAPADGRVEDTRALGSVRRYLGAVLQGGQPHDQDAFEHEVSPLIASLSADGDGTAAGTLRQAVGDAADGDLASAHDRVEFVEYELRGLRAPPSNRFHG